MGSAHLVFSCFCVSTSQAIRMQAGAEAQSNASWSVSRELLNRTHPRCTKSRRRRRAGIVRRRLRVFSTLIFFQLLPAPDVGLGAGDGGPRGQLADRTGSRSEASPATPRPFTRPRPPHRGLIDGTEEVPCFVAPWAGGAARLPRRGSLAIRASSNALRARVVSRATIAFGLPTCFPRPTRRKGRPRLARTGIIARKHHEPWKSQ